MDTYTVTPRTTLWSAYPARLLTLVAGQQYNARLVAQDGSSRIFEVCERGTCLKLLEGELELMEIRK